MLSWILSAVTIDSKQISEITYLKSNKLRHDTKIWKKSNFQYEFYNSKDKSL